MGCEREYLLHVIKQHDEHITHAAEALGITRKTLWEKMRKLGIKAQDKE